MSLHITHTRMTSDNGHHGWRRPDGMWEVSWLPGRRLAHPDAVTALSLAEAITATAATDTRPDPYGPATGALIEVWARELGLTRERAVRLVRAHDTANRGNP